MVKKVVRTNFASLVRQKEEQMKLNRRLKQKEIAEALGITEHTVSKWMRGEVGQINLPLIAQMLTYFDCDIDDLLVVDELPEGV